MNIYMNIKGSCGREDEADPVYFTCKDTLSESRQFGQSVEPNRLIFCLKQKRQAAVL